MLPTEQPDRGGEFQLIGGEHLGAVPLVVERQSLRSDHIKGLTFGQLRNRLVVSVTPEEK
jgi:hypothetical protein